VGDAVEGPAAVEVGTRAGAGREEAVGDGLGVEVREVGLREVGDEEFLKCLVEAGQAPGAGLVALFELLGEDGAEEAGAVGELDRQLLGGGRLGEGEVEELLEERPEVVEVLDGRRGAEVQGLGAACEDGVE
jgi:hypothetical protein